MDPAEDPEQLAPPYTDASWLQVQVQVAGRRCVVVGAGPVGTRRARSLVAAGARVVVVAPEPSDDVEAMAGAGSVQLHRRSFQEDDVHGAAVVVAATGVPEVDTRVGDAARAVGALVNRADDAAAGDLAFPATLRRGPVAVAVSTSGRAPAVARWLAELLGDRLDELMGSGPEGYERLVGVVDEVRSELARRASGPGAPDGATGATPRPVDWRAALDGSILDLIDQGRLAEAKERLLACLSSS